MNNEFIVAAGNTEVPALLAIQALGFTTQCECHPDNEEWWIASKEDLRIEAASPLELLGLAAMRRERGPDWKASDEEIEKYLAKMQNSLPSPGAAPELIEETSCEVDDWPFVVRSFRTSEQFTVQSYLRNMPVSHAYQVDAVTHERRLASGDNALLALVELARQDLTEGKYRTWIVHWASR